MRTSTKFSRGDGELDPSQANYSFLDDMVGDVMGGEARGVVVVNTEPGSAADEAGFRPGDVILEVDGAPVNSIRQFLRVVASTKAQYVIVRVDRFIPAIKSKVTLSRASIDFQFQ